MGRVLHLLGEDVGRVEPARDVAQLNVAIPEGVTDSNLPDIDVAGKVSW
jgi:hypothetical protein